MRIFNLFILLLPFIFGGCIKNYSGMVLVPAGTYSVGSDEVDVEERAMELGIVENWFENETPERKVGLKQFYIDIHEVSNEDYKTFIDETGYRPPKSTRRRWKGRTYPAIYAKEPVAFVSWDDAYYYCTWADKRLPTEEEWEAAARGIEGNSYPWGNKFSIEKSNVGGKKGGPTNVGSYLPSALGIYDMAGNVWEWTDSWYDAYSGNDIPDEKYGTSYRVIRGNSWASVGHYSTEDEDTVLSHNSRSAFRLYLDPKGRTNDLGFRCVKSVSPFFERVLKSFKK